ncbi:MAG: hypothetical protein AB7G44_04120 [Bacteroidia bacterium]
MKTKQIIPAITAILVIVVIFAFTYQTPSSLVKRNEKQLNKQKIETKGCVFKTVFEGKFLDSNFVYQTPQKVTVSVKSALTFLGRAQHQDGGWGAGSHANQGEMNPHAVQPDPATTSMVAMALLRSGSTLNSGEYSQELNKALEYLLKQVENSNNNSTTITSLTGTQIQSKLGANIDVVLTSQFLTNVLDSDIKDEKLKERIKAALNTCVVKIQKAQNSNGSFQGSGWAGVLQSSFANNALEAAQAQGISVDTAILQKSRDFQKGNFDEKTGAVNTDLGAGVVLYSVSSSTRASAKEARSVEEKFVKAKREGKIAEDAEVTTENLEQIGYGKAEAQKYSTSYNVYNAAKTVAQQDNVTSGFGNNGGEEFLSFLQTGESMIIGKDLDWKKWYDKTSGTLLGIQNRDGSWNGHHCITSPVFCTATSVLILTVNNDIDKLVAMGGK